MANKENVAPAAVESKEKDPRKIVKRVIVHRTNVDQDNTNLIIVVNDLGVSNGRASFYPGQEVDLTLVQISILKEAVERQRIDIPLGSGIYESTDPVKAAANDNPGFRAAFDKASGTVYLEKLRPNYAIIEVG